MKFQQKRGGPCRPGTGLPRSPRCCSSCIGCYFYLAELMMSPDEIMSLPLDQRQMLAARPNWYYWAFGVAVWVGLFGTVGLLLRKPWADRMLLASLIAVVVQFSAIFIVPEMRLVSSDSLLGPVLVVLLCYGIWQLARLAKRRGWLDKGPGAPGGRSAPGVKA